MFTKRLSVKVNANFAKIPFALTKLVAISVVESVTKNPSLNYNGFPVWQWIAVLVIIATNSVKSAPGELYLTGLWH